MVKNKDIYYSKNPMYVYDSGMSTFLNKFFKNYSREEVAAEMGLRGGSCLDIACGDGELLNSFISKDYKTAEGIDISKELIGIARSKKVKNCIYNIGDIDDFVKDAIKKGKKYDSVYLLAILEHIQWPTMFLENIYKIVKKGGHIVIETPNVAWLPHRLSLAMGKFPITAPTVGAVPGVYDEHIRFFTHATMNKVVLDTGFKFLKFDCSGKFRPIKRINLKLLSPDIFAVYTK
jgi:2-polyprenyl-3-methyl-5-hydroxy-6-metoxy-1,4-benzoquinol methylase